MMRRLLGSLAVGNSSHFALVAYFGIWVLRELHHSATTLGIGYLLAATAACLAGPVLGGLSDRVGRKRVLTGSLLAHAAAIGAVLMVSRPSAIMAFGMLVVAMIAAAARGAATAAAVTDLAMADAPEARRESFARMRVAANLGAIIGPVLGGAAVALDWSAFFGLTLLLDLAALAFVWRLREPAHEPAAAAGAEPTRVARTAVAITAVALVASWTLYYAFEVGLPIASTGRYHVPAGAWGALFALNAVSIVLLQLRVTRWTGGWSLSVRLSISAVLMGLAFSALLVLPNIVGVAITVVIFSLGEMLWLPSAQELMTALAPAGRRGAIMGLLNSAVWIGLAIASNAAVPPIERHMESAVWLSAAAVGALALTGYVLASRRTELTS